MLTCECSSNSSGMASPSYLTLRLRSTDMEEAGFCGRGMMVMVASLGRGGGGGGGGGVWYHEGWWTHTKKERQGTNLMTKRYSRSVRDHQPLRWFLRKTYSLWPRDDRFSCVGHFGAVIRVFLQQSLDRVMKHYSTTQNKQKSLTFSSKKLVCSNIFFQLLTL